MSTKKENTRVLTFKEDFKKGKKIIFEKGEQTAIHKNTAAKIKASGGKFDEMTYSEFLKSKKSKK